MCFLARLSAAIFFPHNILVTSILRFSHSVFKHGSLHFTEFHRFAKRSLANETNKRANAE